MVVTSLPSLGQGESGVIFQNFKHKLHHEENSNQAGFSAITIKNAKDILYIQNPTTNTHPFTLSMPVNYQQLTSPYITHTKYDIW